MTKKKEKTQISKMRNQSRGISVDLTELKKIGK
jgi:hypothetical protein